MSRHQERLKEIAAALQSDRHLNHINYKRDTLDDEGWTWPAGTKDSTEEADFVDILYLCQGYLIGLRTLLDVMVTLSKWNGFVPDKDLKHEEFRTKYFDALVFMLERSERRYLNPFIPCSAHLRPEPVWARAVYHELVELWCNLDKALLERATFLSEKQIKYLLKYVHPYNEMRMVLEARGRPRMPAQSSVGNHAHVLLRHWGEMCSLRFTILALQDLKLLFGDPETGGTAVFSHLADTVKKICTRMGQIRKQQTDPGETLSKILRDSEVTEFIEVRDMTRWHQALLGSQDCYRGRFSELQPLITGFVRKFCDGPEVSQWNVLVNKYKPKDEAPQDKQQQRQTEQAFDTAVEMPGDREPLPKAPIADAEWKWPSSTTPEQDIIIYRQIRGALRGLQRLANFLDAYRTRKEAPQDEQNHLEHFFRKRVDELARRMRLGWDILPAHHKEAQVRYVKSKMQHTTATVLSTQASTPEKSEDAVLRLHNECVTVWLNHAGSFLQNSNFMSLCTDYKTIKWLKKKIRHVEIAEAKMQSEYAEFVFRGRADGTDKTHELLERTWGEVATLRIMTTALKDLDNLLPKLPRSAKAVEYAVRPTTAGLLQRLWYLRVGVQLTLKADLANPSPKVEAADAKLFRGMKCLLTDLSTHGGTWKHPLPSLASRTLQAHGQCLRFQQLLDDIRGVKVLKSNPDLAEQYRNTYKTVARRERKLREEDETKLESLKEVNRAWDLLEDQSAPQSSDMLEFGMNSLTGALDGLNLLMSTRGVLHGANLVMNFMESAYHWKGLAPLVSSDYPQSLTQPKRKGKGPAKARQNEEPAVLERFAPEAWLNGNVKHLIDRLWKTYLWDLNILRTLGELQNSTYEPSRLFVPSKTVLDELHAVAQLWNKQMKCLAGSGRLVSIAKQSNATATDVMTDPRRRMGYKDPGMTADYWDAIATAVTLANMSLKAGNHLFMDKQPFQSPTQSSEIDYHAMLRILLIQASQLQMFRLMTKSLNYIASCDIRMESGDWHELKSVLRRPVYYLGMTLEIFRILQHNIGTILKEDPTPDTALEKDLENTLKTAQRNLYKCYDDVNTQSKQKIHDGSSLAAYIIGIKEPFEDHFNFQDILANKEYIPQPECLLFGCTIPYEREERKPVLEYFASRSSDTLTVLRKHEGQIKSLHNLLNTVEKSSRIAWNPTDLNTFPDRASFLAVFADMLFNHSNTIYDERQKYIDRLLTSSDEIESEKELAAAAAVDKEWRSLYKKFSENEKLKNMIQFSHGSLDKFNAFMDKCIEFQNSNRGREWKAKIRECILTSDVRVPDFAGMPPEERRGQLEVHTAELELLEERFQLIELCLVFVEEDLKRRGELKAQRDITDKRSSLQMIRQRKQEDVVATKLLCTGIELFKDVLTTFAKEIQDNRSRIDGDYGKFFGEMEKGGHQPNEDDAVTQELMGMGKAIRKQLSKKVISVQKRWKALEPDFAL